MEVTGKKHLFSTPASRNRKRDNAVLVGKAQETLTSQPFLVSYVAGAFGLAAFLEKVYS